MHVIRQSDVDSVDLSAAQAVSILFVGVDVLDTVLPKSVVKTGGGFGLSPDFTRFSPRSVGLTNF